MLRILALFFLISPCFPLSLFAEGDLDQHADKVVKNSVPAWVVKNTIDPSLKPPENRSSGGIWYLCSERQVHIEKGTNFAHYAYRFLNPAGLDDKTQLSFNFDPAHQTLNIHSLIIHRDGKELDRLAESEVRLIQREDGHERQLYDGSLTAIIILKDIRVGDILDYSYSIVGKNPVFAGHYCTFQTLGYSTPVHFLYKRFIWDPKVRTLRHKLFCTKEKTHVSKIKGNDSLNQLVFKVHNSPSITRDSSTPAWYNSSPMIQITDYDSWTDFGTWATPIYKITSNLPESLRAVCDEIKKLPDDNQRIMATLKHVQDNIRYLGSFMGKHSHQPYTIETICERRFGDCKDKSIMLCTMLQYLGYDAVPALVDTDDRGRISQYLPSHFDFDHVIVCLRHAGDTYWLDGTDYYQGGNISNLYISDYGRAFVIDEKSTELTKTKPQGHSTKGTVISEHFEFPDLSGKIDYTVTTTATGADADYWRYRIATNSKEKLSEEALKYYSSIYPEIKSKTPIIFTDDPIKNRIVIRRTYSIADFWEADEDDATEMSGLIEARSTYNKIDYPSSPLRTMPYKVSHPINLTHVIRIDFPMDWNLPQVSEKIENDTFKFSATSETTDRSLTLRYRYQTKSDFVTAQSLKSYLDECDKAEDSTYYWLTYNTSIIDGQSSGKQDPLGTILTLSVACALGLATLLSIILYFYDPKPRNIIEPTCYTGLSGWLVLVAIRVCLDPLISLSVFSDTSEFFNSTGIQDLLDGGYDNLTVAYFVSLSSTAFLIPFSILLIVLFFGKRSSFPRVYIAYMILSLLMEIVTYRLIMDSAGLEQSDLNQTMTGLATLGIGLALWIPYMLISIRVRNTFRVMRSPSSTPDAPNQFPTPPAPPVPPTLPASPPSSPIHLGNPPILTSPPIQGSPNRD